MCDYCRRRSLREAFSCPDCNYDLVRLSYIIIYEHFQCLDCTKKKTKSRGEGMLRGDKGSVEEREVSNWHYVKKGLSFAAPHTLLIILAMTMMVATSAAQLL